MLAVLFTAAVAGAGAHGCPNTATNAEAWFQSILGDTITIDTFFSTVWGRGPLLLSGVDRRDRYHDLVPVTILEQVVDSQSTHPHRLRTG
jgi:hypothetical protein